MAALSRLETLRSLRIANVDVAFATAFATLTTGAFLVGFVQSLGGSDLWIGVLSAIPSLFGILQIPGAIWGRSFSGYKSFVAPGGFLWRLLYAPLLVLPLLPVPNALKLIVLMACLVLASISTNIVNPIYNDWMAEIVPPQSRGTFFGRRNGIAAATASIAGFAGAFILDMQRTNGRENLGYSLLFGLGIVCASISLFFFRQMPEVKRESPVRQNLKNAIRDIGAPFGDHDYRRVLGFLVVFVFAQMFAGNLYFAFARETLRLDFKIIQGTQITMAIGTIAGAGLWGFISDRYGNKPVLVLAGFGLALLPIPWMVCQPGHTTTTAIVLIASHIFMGLVWSGINLCQFNLILSTANPNDRANYIAAAMAVCALVGGISPLLGAGMMASLRGVMDPEHGYKAVFVATIVLRVFALLFLLPVKEEGASRVRHTLRDLRNMTPRGYRAMRNLSRTADGEGRERALERVGSEGTLLASDEIAKALQDPVPRVRRQAATALAQLRDPRAVVDLVRLIEEHPDLLEEETIEALGTLRDASAVPTLIRTLRNPRSILRRASARALGRIGHDVPEVVEALAQAAADKTDPDLRRASLQALRLTGFGTHAHVILEALLDPLPSVRVAAAEAIAELAIPDARENLRKSLQLYADEASSEIAYALGAVGLIDDLELILAEAARETTATARRRALLGAARLLGVEPETYRLLLLEGLGRDHALLEMLKPMVRAQRRVQVALQKYSEGAEAAALDALLRVHAFPALKGNVDELVLVAFAVAAKTHAERVKP